MMKLSEQGIALIKSFEGLMLKAYKDSAGVWTIGYGSTRYQNNVNIQPNDKLEDEKQASILLLDTLAQYEDAVNKGIHVVLNQNQFDALVSITYNVGIGIMHSSTLSKKLNMLDYRGAADQFLVWNKITSPTTHAKLICTTLTFRRKKERNLFLKPIENDT